MLCRVVEADAQACRAEDFFDAATLGGAAALGRKDLGRLSPGAKADLVVVDFDDPAMGQNIDPIQTLMLNGSGREISTVVINGKFVMEDRQIKGIDDRELRLQAQDQFDRSGFPISRQNLWAPACRADFFNKLYHV